MLTIRKLTKKTKFCTSMIFLVMPTIEICIFAFRVIGISVCRFIKNLKMYTISHGFKYYTVCFVYQFCATSQYSSKLKFSGTDKNPVSPPLACAKHIHPPNLTLSASPSPPVHPILTVDPRPFPRSSIRPNLILRGWWSCDRYS